MSVIPDNSYRSNKEMTWYLCCCPVLKKTTVIELGPNPIHHQQWFVAPVNNRPTSPRVLVMEKPDEVSPSRRAFKDTFYKVEDQESAANSD